MTLRRRLFAAIGVVAALSVALAFAVGALLTRRAVERNTLVDVSAKFDLLVERERDALLPFSRLESLQRFLDDQDERVVRVPLDGSSPLLPEDEAARLRRGIPFDGTVTVEGERLFVAVRLVNGKGFALLRPISRSRRGPSLPQSISYFLVSALAAPGFGLPGAFGPVPVDARIFFLSALGFFASRLLRF